MHSDQLEHQIRLMHCLNACSDDHHYHYSFHLPSSNVHSVCVCVCLNTCICMHARAYSTRAPSQAWEDH